MVRLEKCTTCAGRGVTLGYVVPAALSLLALCVIIRVVEERAATQPRQPGRCQCG